MKIARLFAPLLAVLPALPVQAAAPHNVIIFVADGLRSESVNAKDAPTLWRVKTQGVDFRNSHSVYVTVTTANASAIATGHYLGDTGDYGNAIYTGFPLKTKEGSNVVFLESDVYLREVKAHFGAGYLGQPSLLSAARAHGFSSLTIGKTGPAAIQDIASVDPGGPMLFDDSFNQHAPDGTPYGVPLDPALADAIKKATSLDAPPPTDVPNTVQQAYMQTATTAALLPYLKAKGKPFVMLYWSRDPDATQHSQIDSPGALIPGINGRIAKAGIMDADNNLKALLDTLQKLGLDKTTDVFVTADHGFSTISKSIPDENGDIGAPNHPQGFLAVDVANWLGKKLFDPDAGNSDLDFAGEGVHPSHGDGLIGDTPAAPQAAVVANGGSDFIYIFDTDRKQTATTIYDKLIRQPYTGGVFVNDDLIKEFGAAAFPGALRMSQINYMGSSTVPRPAFIVSFRSFDAKGCTLGFELCAAELADTPLITGQGMHGTFSRADTHNFMAAIGPDFKSRFVDTAPVSNADIAPTLAHILGFDLGQHTPLSGRAALEALMGGKKAIVAKGWVAATGATPAGDKQFIEYQQVGATRYFDAAGIPARTVGLSAH
ncbi:MAG TPA: alkaline phosphatase family protein [Rhizomicrobium sp.]|nr:alkaline phosphatase family protein [Rhizomicrobium sp.]